MTWTIVESQEQKQKRIRKMAREITFYIGLSFVFIALQGVYPLDVFNSYLLLFTGNLIIVWVSFLNADSKVIAITILMAIAQITRVAL